MTNIGSLLNTITKYLMASYVQQMYNKMLPNTILIKIICTMKSDVRLPYVKASTTLYNYY